MPRQDWVELSELGARYSRFVLLVVTVALQSGCEPQRPEDPSPEARALAVIGGEVLPAAPLEERAARWRRARIATGRPPTAVELRRHRAVLARQLVNQRLVLAAAAANDPPLQPPADDVLLAEFAAREGPGFTAAAYEKRTGESTAELLARLRADHLLAQLVGPEPAVSRERVTAWYEAHRDQYQKPSASRLQRLVWSAPASAPASLREQARAAAAQASTFERFEQLVSRPMALASPTLVEGWFAGSELPSAVARHAEAAGRGQISGVLTTADGFEVVRLQDRRPAERQSLDSAEASIRATLRQRWRSQRQSEVLAGMRRRFAVEEPLWRETVAVEQRAEARRKRADLTLRAGGIVDPSQPGTTPSRLVPAAVSPVRPRRDAGLVAPGRGTP